MLAAFIYGFGWVLTARFYGKFGVSPEEVGVGFAFLLVRVVFVLMASLVILGSIWGSLRWLSERVGWLEIPTSSPLRLVAGAIAVSGGALVVVLLPVIAVPVAVPVITNFLGDLYRRRRRNTADANVDEDTSDRPSREPHSRPMRIDLGHLLKVTSWFFAVAAVAMVLLAPFILADRLASQVRIGDELAVSVLPGVAGLRVQKVMAMTTDGMPVTESVPNGSCVSLLGSSEVAVLYDHRRGVTSRVPVGRLSLEQPCNRGS